MKRSSASYSKKRKWLIGALTPVMAVCLATGLILMSATNVTDGVEHPVYAAQGFNNIVNANVGMHPKWELDTCATVDQGGVGDTYTSAHKIWRVTTDDTNDPIMEKSPSYVFTGNETYATELAETYNLKQGNEVVFNITEQDTAAKVWADAIAFAQSIGTETALVENDLANCKGDNNSANNETHNGWRVGSNVGKRNYYKGNFFLENQDGALGQYITVRLQTDWKAKDITAAIPQKVTKVADNTTGDYITIGGDTRSLTTTTFDYIRTELQDENGGYLKDNTNYLDSLGSKEDFNDVTDFNCISEADGYTLSYDLASNGFDYDVNYNETQAGEDKNARSPTKALNVFNDICAFSFGRLHIPTGVYILLDLNGHTIDRNLTGKDKTGADKGDYYGSVFSVSNVARLEIMDSSAYENASAARIESDESGAHTTNHKGTITGGHIIGAEDSYTDKYQKNAVFPNDMRLRFQYMGGAVNIAPWGDFVMDSGTVMSNNVTGPDKGSSRGGSGGAFYQRSKAAVTIYDGYVIDNSVSNKGGVTILGDGSGCAFTMYGGVLAHNTSGYLGGAVHLGTSTYANFHGGEIVNNTTGARGGAINLFANTLGILDSVTITGNKVTGSSSSAENGDGHGGAIYIDHKTYTIDQYRIQNKHGPGFQFRGSLQIYGNTVGESDKEENVFLSYMDEAAFKKSNKNSENVSGSGVPTTKYIGHFAQIAIGGPMIENGIVANVGVTLGKYDDATAANNVFTYGYGKGNEGVDTFLYFHSDNKKYAVVNQDDKGREATLNLATSVPKDVGLTWLIEGTGTDADTVIGEGGGESTFKIVIPSGCTDSKDATFFYKNPSNTKGLTSLKQVVSGDKMNRSVPRTKGDPTDELLDILQDRFKVSSGTLEFEYSMLKVTKISAYTGSPNFSVSGDALTQSGGNLLKSWECESSGSSDKPIYTVKNTFDNANFHFKLGEKDLTSDTTKESGVSEEMQKAISATDGSISYAGEYSVLVSGVSGERYSNPSFKIKINQVGVEVGRTLYYNGQNVETDLKWIKDWINWNGDTVKDNGNDPTKADETDQPYFIYTGSYYYPILNADYERLSIFNLYDPYTKSYTTVSKNVFTGYVLEFTYANQYFGKDTPVKFGSHSGGGIEYQTMHRKPGTVSGTGTYVPGVRNAGMYEVQFISSRSAQSADERNEDYKATGVYFAANNFAFSSKINIYVDPATAEVELTKEAQAGFTYNAREIKDESIVIYDNTSNTHVNPHLDDAAKLEYYLFDSLKLKAGIYDVRTKLYYTLDEIIDWENHRPYGRKNKPDGQEDEAWVAQAEEKGRPYFSSFMDSELVEAPKVLWEEGKSQFNPAETSSKILSEQELKAFQALYEKDVYRESTGKLVYIVDASSFGIGQDKAKKLETNPTDARRYVVFVTLELDVGYDDYNYIFDQDAAHLVGLGDGTSYFWAFEFTVNPAEINPIEGINDGKTTNTEVSLTKDVWYNGESYGYKYYSEVVEKDTVWKFDTSTLSEQANLPTVMYYGNGAGSALQLHGDYEIAYASFDENPNGETTFNYLDASVGLDSKGHAFNGFNFGAYNLAVKITFGGSNKNYVNKKYENGAADGTGTAYEDGDGAFYIYFRICPVVVSASGSLSYTYDGGNFDRARYLDANEGHDEWYESIFFLVQDGITTPNELIEHQHANEYTTTAEYEGQKRDLSDLWSGIEGERKGKTYADTSFYKGRYTLGNVSVSYSNEEFKNHHISFGLGLYSFNTGNANYQATPYHLTTTAYDEQGQKGATGDGVGVVPKETGVTWVLTTTVNGVQTQTFNTSRNFIINETDSWLNVTIGQKNISNDYGSIVQFGEKTFDHISSGGTSLGSSKTGVSYPFAGNDWSYFPAVKFNYVPSFSVPLEGNTSETRYYEFGQIYDHGATSYKGTKLEVALSGSEGESFSGISLSYTSNGTVSGDDGAVVRVTGMGNYIGTFRLTFTITPAQIEAAFENKAEVRYNMQPHAPQITYTNIETYTTYLTGEDGFGGAALLQYTGGGPAPKYEAPVPGGSGYQAPTIEYRSLRSAYEGATDNWTTAQPVDAKKYKIRVSTTSLNFVFADTSDFDHTLPQDEIENVRTVYGEHTILPAIVSVKATNSEVTYNGEKQSPVLEFSNASVNYVIPRDVDYSIDKYFLSGDYSYDAAAAPTDVGVYTVTIALKETALGKGKYSNFAFDDGGYTTTITFTIQAAEVGVDVTKESIYNGQEQQPTVAFANRQAGNDAVPVVGEYSVSYRGDTLDGGTYPKNAGTYTVTVALTGNGKRNFTLKSGDDEHTFTIVPATVNPFLTVSEESTDPMTDFSIAFDNAPHKAGVGFTSNTDALPNEESYDAYTVRYRYVGWKDWNESDEDAFKNAGYYAVSIDLTENGNYCFSRMGSNYVYTQTLSYSIEHHLLKKADLDFVKKDGAPIYGLRDNSDVIVGLGESGETIVYTGDPIEPIRGLTITGSDERKHTLTPNTDYVITYIGNINAGNCRVIVNGTQNFIGTLNLSFTIAPKSLGTSKEGAGNYNKDNNGDNIFCNPVATYVFSGSAQSVAVNMTYEIDGRKNTLVKDVDYKVLKVYFGDEEKIFASGIVEAGTYTILIQGQGNYDGIYVCEVTVLPAGITARAKTESFTYDGNPHLSGVIFVAGTGTKLPAEVDWDNANDLFIKQADNHTWIYTNEDYTLTISDVTGYKPFVSDAFESGDGFKNAGTYTVTVEFLEGKDFVFANPTGENPRVMTYKFTINPSVIAISGFESTTYNGKEQGVDIGENTFTAISGGLTSAKILELLKTKNDFDAEKITYGGIVGKPTDAGRYTVTVPLKEGGNFAFSRTSNTTYVYRTTATFTIDTFNIENLEDTDITIEDCTYTGVTLTPDVTVTFDLGGVSHMLQLTKEFTVSYINNVNASNEAQAVLVGVGNFSGSTTKYFKILKKLIGDGADADEDISATRLERMEYNGTAYSPNLAITYSPKSASPHTNMLIMGSASSDDYDISYFKKDDSPLDGAPKDAGQYYIVVTANGGNYEGSFKIEFTITATILTLTLNGADAYIYTGTAVSPGVFLLSTNGASPEPGDYTVGDTTYVNDGGEAVDSNGDTNAGRYTITVTITSDNYVFAGGTKEDSVSYRILPARLQISLREASTAYSGTGHDLKDQIVFTNQDGSVIPSASEYTIAYDVKGGSKGELDGDKFPLTLGNYTVTVTLHKDGNFIFDAEGYDTSDPDTYVPSAYVLSKDLDYAIGQMSTTVELAHYSLIYNTEAQKQEPVFGTTVITSDDYTVEYKYSPLSQSAFVLATDFANAGRYEVTVTLKARDEYDQPFFKLVNSTAGTVTDGTSWTVTYEIARARVRIDLIQSSGTYNGESFDLHSDSFFSFTNLDGNDAVLPGVDPADERNGFTVSYNSGSHGAEAPLHAGAYTVTVALGDNFTSDGTPFTFTVTPQIVGVGLYKAGDEKKEQTAWTEYTSMAYDGAEYDMFDLISILFTDTVDENRLGIYKDKAEADGIRSYAVQYNGGRFDGKFSAAGIYTITVSLARTGDFSFGYATAYIYDTVLTFTIEQLDIEQNDNVRLQLVVTGGPYYYTGSAITLGAGDVEVYLIHRHKVGNDWVDYGNDASEGLKPVLLTSEQYLLMYANNTDAGMANVTVVGQGAITGQDHGTFEIMRKPLGTQSGDRWEKGSEFSIENLGIPLRSYNIFYYNGSKVSLAPSVVYTPASHAAFTLQTSDYTLSWKPKDGGSWTDVATSTPMNAGEYILRVTARDGNYADAFDVDFRILPAMIKATLGTNDYYYTGGGQEAAINFYYLSNDETLNGLEIPGDAVAHTVSYAGADLTGQGLPINAGSYVVTITLTDDCKNFVFSYGTDGLPDEANGRKFSLSEFMIHRALVSAELNKPSATYTGRSIDCRQFISITPIRGGSQSDVWKQAIADFTLTYLGKGGALPVTVGEYKLTVTLNDPNLEFFTHDLSDDKTSTPLTFNVLRASLNAKRGGEFDDGTGRLNDNRFDLTIGGRMDGNAIIYDPANIVKFDIKASEAFELFRAADEVSIRYSVRTDASPSAFAYTGSGVDFTGSGTFEIEVEVTSDNYETTRFTVRVRIVAKDIVITTDGTISTVYGDSSRESGAALLDAFLGIVTKIEGIPGAVTGLAGRKEWLRTWGLGIEVLPENSYSQSGNRKAGSYNLKLTLELADNDVSFAAAAAGDASVSRDGLYVVAKKDVALEWEVDDIEYDATPHYDSLRYESANLAQRDGVFHTAVLDGDRVSFASYTITQYNSDTKTWDPITVTDFALRNVGRYKIAIGQALSGADSANYAFSGAEKEFEITRMVVSVNVADARMLYGEAYKEMLSFIFANDANFEEVLSREGAVKEFEKAEIEGFLKSHLVLRSKTDGIVYDGFGRPPVGQYDIKLGEFEGVDADGTILNDNGVYRNYRFVLYGQYGGATYATLTVFRANVTIILNDKVGEKALEIEYGEYKYPATPTGDYSEDDKLGLTKPLKDYIYENIFNTIGSERRVRNIVGLDEVYPDLSWRDLAQLIVDNCLFEVVNPRISKGGYLMAGTYDLKIVTKESCGFSVSFLPNNSSDTLIGQSGEHRLVISPKVLDIKWATEEEEVKVDGGNIRAIYTGFNYNNSPLFVNISKGDEVGAPIFHFTDLGGTTLADGPVNVGTYYVNVDDISGGADRSCYVLPETLRARLEIVPRPLTVTVDDCESVYGNPFVDLTFKVHWDLENHPDTEADLNITLTKADGKDAGSYAISGSYDNANYDLHFTDATYKITQREITVQMDDITGYYGEGFKDLTFTKTKGDLVYGDRLADLGIVGHKAEGTDADEYAITGDDIDPNYLITILPGTYTIKQAKNEWLGAFSFNGWGAGDPPKTPNLPGSKFGDIKVRYYYDKDCTQEIEDLSALPEGEYFVQLTVAETNNYEGLSETFAFPVEHVIEATLYVILFCSQFVILTAALIFIRRKKSGGDQNNNQ